MRGNADSARGAKRGSLLVNVPYLDENPPRIDPKRPLRATLYDRGAIIHWRVEKPAGHAKGATAPRGRINDMSMKSRLRAAFLFSNAPSPWWAMATLTFSIQPKNSKVAFDKFKRRLRDEWDCACQWGWIMEYQQRGVVHYHLFFSSDFGERNGIAGSGNVQVIMRRGESTSILRGRFDDWAVRNWIDSTGDHSEPFARFQEGGIVEIFRHPDGAARYVAKEAGKRHQKALPQEVEGGHRWWWISPEGKPRVRDRVKLLYWPFDKALSKVFDYGQLHDFIDYEHDT
jgi:hypothetical protein